MVVLKASQGPVERAECLKTEMAPVQQREPQASPAILTGLTVNQWPRSYLVHLAGDPFMALAER